MLIAGIVIGVIVWIVGVILSDKQPGLIIGVIIVTFAFLFIAIGADDGSYEEGQIDAINGIIKYELQTQENNSIKWVEVEE